MKVLGVGTCSLEGPTHENEDRFVQFCGDEARVLTASSSSSSSSAATTASAEGPSFFAVYDGHAGDMVVTHVAQALHAHIFSPANRALFFPSASTTDDATSSVEEVILQGFARTEEEVLALNEKRNDISGACAVAVVHHGDRLYVANLGDSRALIGRKKVKGSFIGRLTLTKASRVEDIESREKQKRVSLRVQHSSSFLKTLTQDKIRCTAVPLTRDLKAVASYERQRIIAAGGWIRRGRVFGVLAPSRSFGDPLEKGRMRGRKMRRGTVKGGEGRKVEVEDEERKAAEEAERGGGTATEKKPREGDSEEEASNEKKSKKKNKDTEAEEEEEMRVSKEGEKEAEEERKDDEKEKEKESREGDDDDDDEAIGRESTLQATPAPVIAVVVTPDVDQEDEEESKESKEKADKSDTTGDHNDGTSNGGDSGVSVVTADSKASSKDKEKTESGTIKTTTTKATKTRSKTNKKGNSDMKKLKGVKEGVVIAVPEMTVHTLEPADDFLVLATDGLWDVMDNKAVVDHVSPEVLKWRRLKEEEDREREQGQQEGQSEINELRQSAADFLDSICRGLCKRAKRRGSRDDITVVIVVFDPLTTE